MSWQRQNTRVVYENRWIRVREDAVIGPAGTGIYGVVELQHPAVFVVAVDEADRVCLVTLPRYTTGTLSIEVPAGGTDGEDPLIAAQRELREETGFEASEWQEIGRMHALNGIADAPEHVFLARGLQPSHIDTTADRAEEGIHAVEWVPFTEVLGLVTNGQISDGETVAALAYAAIHLGRIT